VERLPGILRNPPESVGAGFPCSGMDRPGDPPAVSPSAEACLYPFEDVAIPQTEAVASRIPILTPHRSRQEEIAGAAGLPVDSHGPVRSALSRIGSMARGLARRVIPRDARRALVRATRIPPVGTVDLGDLRRPEPVSRSWGGDRGLPVDRYYIEQFLAANSSDIRGRVLEIGDNEYTLRFGQGRVETSEILHAAPGNPRATYVDDLAVGRTLPDAAFDCIVCTQTLHVIPDMVASVRTLARILKPGGVLLATAPGISQIYRDEEGRWGDYWRLTNHSALWLMEQAFGPGTTTVEVRGNVLSATAFLQGLASGELTPEELDARDPDYQVSLGIRVVRSGRI
jgi:SAM-dependent methyltransferase